MGKSVVHICICDLKTAKYSNTISQHAGCTHILEENYIRKKSSISLSLSLTHTYLKQGSSFTDLPATRGPDCAKLYIGPGKKSDDECDCTEDGGGGASPITKAETRVKNKLYIKKNHKRTSHQAIFLYNTYNIR